MAIFCKKHKVREWDQHEGCTICNAEERYNNQAKNGSPSLNPVPVLPGFTTHVYVQVDLVPDEE